MLFFEILIAISREAFTEKVTFGQRHKGDEIVSREDSGEPSRWREDHVQRP